MAPLHVATLTVQRVYTQESFQGMKGKGEGGERGERAFIILTQQDLCSCYHRRLAIKDGATDSVIEASGDDPEAYGGRDWNEP